MIAIVGGLTAAICWASANLASARSSRMIGSSSTVGWMMLVGVLLAGPLAIASGPLPPITGTLAIWLALSGVTGVAGLSLVYRGLSLGKVGVVTALVSTEGAIAAVLSVVGGEGMSLAVAATLCVIMAGIGLVGLASGDAAKAAEGAEEGSVLALAAADERRAVLFGIAAALCFGVTIYSSGQAGQVLPPFVAVLPVRVVGVVAILIPLALTGRLRLARPAVPLVILIGAGEVFGNAAYVWGARQSIAIAAVLASQFAAVAAVAAFFIYRERLSTQQRAGIVAICAGVAALTIARG